MVEFPSQLILHVCSSTLSRRALNILIVLNSWSHNSICLTCLESDSDTCSVQTFFFSLQTLKKIFIMPYTFFLIAKYHVLSKWNCNQQVILRSGEKGSVL